MSCGAPEVEAGSLMSHDGKGHCFFVRQPTTAEEVNTAILSLWSSCCGAVRYGGHDDGILFRLAEIGENNACDFRLENEPKQALISHLTFEFVRVEALKSGLLVAREITEYFAGFLTKRYGAGSRVLDFCFLGTTASFRLEWGRDSLSSTPCSVTFTLQPDGDNSWLLRIQRDDRPKVQWFTEEEWKQRAYDGRASPF